MEYSFTFTSKAHNNLNLTKRLVLSEVAQIFDPLGFLSLVIIRAKVLLQELWLHNLKWDDPLPSTSQLDGSRSEKILQVWPDSQYLGGSTPTAILQWNYMASPTYLNSPWRNCSDAGKINEIRSSKSQHCYGLSTLLQISNSTDSQVTLTWIKSHASRWKDYIKNRVTQIQEITQTAHCIHIPGTSNPADCASRGLTTAQLEQHRLWWRGPPWLSQSRESWPAQHNSSDDTCLQECRPGISHVLTCQKLEYHWHLIYKYFSLHKLFHITSACFSFISKLRKSTAPSIFVSNLPVDLKKAKTFWIKATQSAYFSHELKMMVNNQTLPSSHVFSRLTAFMDDQGVIRVGGRLTNAPLTYEDHSHKATLHRGTEFTLAHIRQTYWIIGGRAPVKSYILRCVVPIN
uniref:uncharacterized protein LOC117609678 n=1 Tax=Osmia lignaria TaxID=473952 RepID=UPI00147832EE|nr:uncharacterized protein LOC117609678 [Osmia lignaria]